MDRRFELSLLSDFYGPLLTERRRAVLKMHFDEDLSYQEIAEQLGISRQGVHDAIKSAGEQLVKYEEILGLAGRYQRVSDEVAALRECLNAVVPSAETGEMLAAAIEKLDNIESIER